MRVDAATTASVAAAARARIDDLHVELRAFERLAAADASLTLYETYVRS
jgi:hypothetical protein